MEISLEKIKLIVSKRIVQNGLRKSKVHTCEACVGLCKSKVDTCEACNWLSQSKAYTCAACNLIVNPNKDTCAQCGDWIYNKCAGEKRATQQVCLLEM